jgi:hypothetical protein
MGLIVCEAPKISLSYTQPYSQSHEGRARQELIELRLKEHRKQKRGSGVIVLSLWK